MAGSGIISYVSPRRLIELHQFDQVIKHMYYPISTLKLPVQVFFSRSQNKLCFQSISGQLRLNLFEL